MRTMQTSAEESNSCSLLPKRKGVHALAEPDIGVASVKGCKGMAGVCFVIPISEWFQYDASITHAFHCWLSTQTCIWGYPAALAHVAHARAAAATGVGGAPNTAAYTQLATKLESLIHTCLQPNVLPDIARRVSSATPTPSVTGTLFDLSLTSASPLPHLCLTSASPLPHLWQWLQPLPVLLSSAAAFQLCAAASEFCH